MTKIFFNEKLFVQTVSRDINEKNQIEIELEDHRNNLEKTVKQRTKELKEKNKE